MNEELKGIIYNYLIIEWKEKRPVQALMPFIKIDEMISRIEDWHIRERKKWAKGCVPEEKELDF